MKKTAFCVFMIILMMVMSGFTYINNDNTKEEGYNFDLDALYDYQKEYKTEELSVCSGNTAKTYMDYRMTTVVDSRQYQSVSGEFSSSSFTGTMVFSSLCIIWTVSILSRITKRREKRYVTVHAGQTSP